MGEGPLKEQLVGQLADTHYQHFAFIMVNRSVEDNTHINPFNVVKGTNILHAVCRCKMVR